ncbi:MAG: hypothetical protein ACLQBA_23560 [Candidatus Binataceae bacterium]
MLGEYFQGTLPQLIERARLLKGKIPRSLPRDYGALVRTSEIELDDVISRLRNLQGVPAAGRRALHHARLRQFKRAIADLDHIETTAIAVLNRAHKDDHHANRLLYRICQEISHPALTPTVTTLSTSYFYIDTKLNLMFIPPAEGSFLLHLPDLYHELGHPLLTHENHPVLDRLRTQYLACMAHIHDYFASQREREGPRRGPRAFKDQIDLWELLWSKYWLTEFFCDLYAVLTLGPAFAWSHLHLYLKIGGNAFALPDGLRNLSHPADDARMRAILEVLRRSGFQNDVAEISRRWLEALDLTTDLPVPDYMHCYPDELITFVVEKAAKGVADMECRLARPATSDPVHLMLNEAWRNFWRDPASYHTWEARAVQELFSLCEGSAVVLNW